ncbi:MAG: hypothetical protein WC307_03530 [Candidatus Nanoarchaeia archaeon]|jgi:hypothetical protein
MSQRTFDSIYQKLSRKYPKITGFNHKLIENYNKALKLINKNNLIIINDFFFTKLGTCLTLYKQESSNDYCVTLTTSVNDELIMTGLYDKGDMIIGGHCTTKLVEHESIIDDLDKFTNEVHKRLKPRIVVAVAPIENISSMINDDVFLPDQIKTINTLKEILLKSI